jgi:hypothetical protein
MLSLFIIIFISQIWFVIIPIIEYSCIRSLYISRVISFFIIIYMSILHIEKTQQIALLFIIISNITVYMILYYKTIIFILYSLYASYCIITISYLTIK